MRRKPYILPGWGQKEWRAMMADRREFWRATRQRLQLQYSTHGWRHMARRNPTESDGWEVPGEWRLDPDWLRKRDRARKWRKVAAKAKAARKLAELSRNIVLVEKSTWPLK